MIGTTCTCPSGPMPGHYDGCPLAGTLGLPRPKDLTVTLKADLGKPRVDLLPVRVLFSVAEVLGFGAKKYLPDNWRNGTTWRRYYASALRHTLAWGEGEDLDPESGLNHLDHAICDLMFLREFQHAGIGEDDRYKTLGDDRAA